MKEDLINSEEKLIKKAQKGEKEAFGLLYDKYIDQIYRFVYLKTNNKQDSEDLSQQIFLNAWENIKNYQPKGFPFSSWLYKIARNLIVDYYRTKKVNLDLEDASEKEYDFFSKGDLELDLETKIEIEKVKKVILQLPSEQQNLIIMKFIEELSNKEIAQILNKSEGAIRVLQHRALKQLKKILEKQ